MELRGKPRNQKIQAGINVKIVCFPHNYLPHFNSGGESYIHRLLKYLQSFGHEITVIANYPDNFIYEGITVVSQGEIKDIWTANNDLIKNCDVVIGQLIGSAYASNKSAQFMKPLIWFAHNTHRSYPVAHNPKQYIVYNSEYVKRALGFEHKKTTVLSPLINYRDFKPSPITKRKYITLINCNDNKGGSHLIELAKKLPQYKFLGIKGAYGDQITEQLPNLTYVENQKDISGYYAQTKILLQPSADESYGQTALEAMCCGIPVIFHPTPGLVENMSFAGIGIDRNNLPLYAETIDSLMNDKAKYAALSKLSLDRAIEQDPLPKVDQFNQWLLKVK